MGHTAVHLQALLAVGLAILCFGILLCCFLCWRRGKSCCSAHDKEAPPPPVMAPPITTSLRSDPPAGAVPIRQQYEEIAGDVLEGSASSCSSSPSREGLPSLVQPQLASSFPPQRFSTPTPCPSEGQAHPQTPTHGRASLPSLPRLSLKSRTRRVLKRRSTVTGNAIVTGHASHPTPAKSGHLPHYGSTSSTLHPTPHLHFSLLFRPARGSLTLTALSLSGVTRKVGGAFVKASLPPVSPAPLQAWSRRRSLGMEFQSQALELHAGSLEALRSCTLRVALLTRDFSGLRETLLGSLELQCQDVDWQPDVTFTLTRELQPNKSLMKKSRSSQDALSQRPSLTPAPRALGQVLLLLQYQTPAHRIKVLVRKAENLARITRMPGAPDHYMLINLRHRGVVISTKETKGASGCNAVWNTPFLFELPPGDVNKLPLLLEFIIMQGRLLTRSTVLGRVLIGSEGPEEGQSHWREMCSRALWETSRWHTVVPQTHLMGQMGLF